MQITNRGFKVLEGIIDEYIKTGEPIGSKLLSARLDPPVSPATIRNEMAALEQMGYLDHPHTSAGRIPTVKGYRLYIERLIPENRLNPSLSDEDICILDNAVENIKGDSDEMIIESASHALAQLTKCAVVSTSNINRLSVITKVEVVPAGRRVYVLLLVTSDGDVKNRACRLSFDLTDDQIEFFGSFAREHLSGINLETVSPEYVENLGIALGSYTATLSPLLKAVGELSVEITTGKVNFEGETNLIASDLNRDDVLSILENKNAFTALLENAFSEVSVIFGEDEKEGTFSISNSGIIAKSFHKHGKTAGSFGVIGPMRLDYKKLIPYIEYFSSEVTKMLSNDENDESDENDI